MTVSPRSRPTSSPVGGVGINLAVRDAVAAATVLAGPLRRGNPSVRDPARSQRRRRFPTLLVQGLQHLVHKAVAEPALEHRRVESPAVMVELMKRFPRASVVPACLIGIGVRPEHAPEFARRP